MTLAELEKLLSEYPDRQRHVCLTTTGPSPRRLEIVAVLTDAHGVINIVAGPPCDVVDKEILKDIAEGVYAK